MLTSTLLLLKLLLLPMLELMLHMLLFKSASVVSSLILVRSSLTSMITCVMHPSSDHCIAIALLPIPSHL
jgi:hypothetical protein